MPLRKAWEPLERATVGKAPDRYGVVEFGDEDGTVLSIETGPLRDVLKEQLGYGQAANVRWRATQTPDEAERVADEHRARL